MTTIDIELEDLELDLESELIVVEEPTGFSPNLFFENLLTDIYNTYDKQFWTQEYVDQFMEVATTGTAIEMLAWLLAIGPQDVPEYLEQVGNDTKAQNGLPYFITRFKPSYAAYEKLLATQKPVLTPLPLLEILDDTVNE